MEAGASFVHLEVLLSVVWDSRKKKLQTINWLQILEAEVK